MIYTAVLSMEGRVTYREFIKKQICIAVIIIVKKIQQVVSLHCLQPISLLFSDVNKTSKFSRSVFLAGVCFHGI